MLSNFSYLLGNLIQYRSKNNNGQAPMELVPHHDHIANCFENLKMFSPFQQYRADFPVQSHSKLFFCGNTVVGKSSLAAVIIEQANKAANHNFDTSKCVTVEPLTAGIDPHVFTSHEVVATSSNSLKLFSTFQCK